MTLFAVIASVKDWAELIRAIAWPAFAFWALWQFRSAIRDVLNRIPWERTKTLESRALGKVTIETKKVEEQKIVEKTLIPIPPEPKEAKSDDREA